MKKAALFFLSILALSTLASPSAFSLSVGGGLSYSAVGELNSALTDWNRYIRVINQVATGEMKTVHLGADLFLEALYEINPRMAVGLGLGYVCAGSKGSTHREYPGYEGTVQVTNPGRPSSTSIPSRSRGIARCP